MRRLFWSRKGVRQWMCIMLLLVALAYQQPPELEVSALSFSFQSADVAGLDERLLENDTKKILFYNTFWRQPDFQFGTGRQPFFDYQCPISNCWIQSMTEINRSATPSHYFSQFDAVIVSVQPQDSFDITQEREDIEKWRQNHQRFVFFIMESQAHLIPTLPEMNGFFNWTMTFKWNSDIPRPYGWFEDKSSYKHPSHVPTSSATFYPRKPKEWIQYNESAFRESLPTRPQSFLNLAKRKGKIAWIVSHCLTDSLREDYVYQLQKYFDVDEFGGKCNPHRSVTCDLPYSVSSGMDNCTRYVQENYKFYLAFENQFCNDYVTEKFFQRMDHSVVITLGQANYSEIAPPHSYISVFDFDSAQDLAKYLQELDADDEKYLSYFWWKDYYQVQHPKSQRTYGNNFGPSMCHLCEKLHDPQQPWHVYDDIETWWKTSATCGENLHGLKARMSQDESTIMWRQQDISTLRFRKTDHLNRTKI